MNLLIKDRGKGKTTRIIYTSESTGFPIVVPTHNMKTEVMHQAEEMECYIPEPVTVSELRNGKTRGMRLYENVLVDEVGFILQDALNEYLGCNVICGTISDDLKTRYKHGNKSS